jgi:hypothetical protein
MINRDTSRVERTLLKKVKKVIEIVNKQLPSGWELAIFETSRTTERQQVLFKQHVTKTLKSKHIPDKTGTCHAVDVVFMYQKNWVWSCNFWHLVEEAKLANGIRIIKSPTFVDHPHCELISIPIAENANKKAA